MNTKPLTRLFHCQLLSLCLLITACGTTNAARERRADLHDVMNIKLHFMSLGADVNVGPANVGLFGISGPDGHGLALSRGITGSSETPYSGVELGLGIPLLRIGYQPKETWTGMAEHHSDGGEEFTRKRESGYADKYPSWGSVGFDIGLILGIGFRFDFCELADFIGGFFGKDLLKDDHLISLRPTVRPEPAAVPDSPARPDRSRGEDRK